MLSQRKKFDLFYSFFKTSLLELQKLLNQLKALGSAEFRFLVRSCTTTIMSWNLKEQFGSQGIKSISTCMEHLKSLI